MPEFQRTRIVKKPIKKHECDECGLDIEVGEEHISGASCNEGEFYSFRLCMWCVNEKYPYLKTDAENYGQPKRAPKKRKVDFKIGDTVNYHSIIGGAITSTGHEITNIGEACGDIVAWISNKSGCVSLDALSKG